MSRYKEFCPNCAFGGCKSAEIIAADKSINAIKCPEWKGLWKYRNLPEGMKKATLKDLFDGDEIISGLKYLLHSFYSGHYETYSLSGNTNIEDLKVFVSEGRCFIKQA